MIETPTPIGENEFNKDKIKNISSKNMNNQESINTEKIGEGKKNIWKMMQKLDKIKTGEIQSSGFDSGTIDEIIENNKINKKPSKFLKEQTKNENDNKSKENENNINNEKEDNDKEQPIIGVLRNNNENKDEEEKEDDSKMNIIKKEESLGLG